MNVCTLQAEGGCEGKHCTNVRKNTHDFTKLWWDTHEATRAQFRGLLETSNMSLMSLIFFPVTVLASLTLLQWVCFAILLVVLTYLFLTRNYGKFEKQGVFCLEPQLLFGNARPIFMQEMPAMDFHRQLYNKYKGHG